MTDVEPFRIAVPDECLSDLRARLDRARYPDQLEGVGWDYGTELESLRALCEHWRQKFDWRGHERAWNEIPQFRTVIDGLGFHFLHVRSPEPDALPLVIVHGWPGSVFEFTRLLRLLTNPRAHGGRREDAFHVVCPALPGFGFSDRPVRPGWDVRRSARAFAALMERLGYPRYGTQGGDWGSYVAREIALCDAERVAGLHLNMVMVPPPPGADPLEGLSESERAVVVRALQVQDQETGYLHIQRTRPQTLGYALHDSPVGLAAWLLEKFRSWSDCGGDVARRFSQDELLGHIMLYWVTGTITSSMRFYRESLAHGVQGLLGDRRVEVPTGCALAPGELYASPRRWAEHYYAVERWTELPSGGHFLALEEPELLVEEIRAFFRPLR